MPTPISDLHIASAEATVTVLEQLAAAVRQRRAVANHIIRRQTDRAPQGRRA